MKETEQDFRFRRGVAITQGLIDANAKYVEENRRRASEESESSKRLSSQPITESKA